MNRRTVNPKLEYMPGSAAAEIYFIAAMMILILIICGVAVYFFARTYKREMAEKQRRAEEGNAAEDQN